MPNLSEVKSIFISIINSSLGNFGGVLIKDLKDTPKANLFIRVRVLGAINDKMLKPISKFNKETGLKEVIYSKELTFSIRAFGINSENILYELQNKLQLDSTSFIFYQNNISLRNQGKVIPLPIEEADSIREHASLDVKIGFQDELIDDIGYFDKVQLNGSFIDTSIIIDKIISI